MVCESFLCINYEQRYCSFKKIVHPQLYCSQIKEVPLEPLIGAATWNGATPPLFKPLKVNERRFFPSAVPGAAPFQQLVTTLWLATFLPLFYDFQSSPMILNGKIPLSFSGHPLGYKSLENDICKE